MPSNLATRSSFHSRRSRRRATGAAAWLTIVLSCGIAEVRAQGRPSQSIFGGTGTDAGAKDLFDVSFSVTEGFDTNVLDNNTGASRGGPAADGFYTGLSGDVRVLKRGRRAELALSGGTNFRYFQDLGEMAAVGHYVGLGFTAPLGQRTTVTVNEAVSYRPPYLFGLFARTQAPVLGEGAPAPTDYAMRDQPSYNSVTTLNLRRRIGRRAWFDVSSGYRRTFAEKSVTGAPNLSSYHAGASVGYPIGRDAVLRLGYTYRHAEYGPQRRPSEHDILLGVDYDRPLSRSRRTRLAFNAGSSVVEGPLPNVSPDASIRHLRANANVTLTHQMGRTWNARAAYRRAADFAEEFSGPVFSDGVTMSMDGFLNRRTDVSGSAAYTTGAVVGRAGSNFTTYTGNARIRFGVTRTWAMFSDYYYYYNDYAAGVPLLINAPPRVSRHGVRIGLMLWLPVYRN